MAAEISAELNAVLVDMFTRQHENDSDSSLQMTILTNARLAQALPATGSSLAKLQELKSENEACSNIIERRKRNASIIDNARKHWAATETKRRDKAILRLPNASSPAGQLIAAILEEEDGKTAQELHEWCEELEAIGDTEFRSLLNGLVAEGVLSYNQGKYYLITICTESLRPEFSVEWAKRRLIAAGTTYELEENLLVLWAINELKHPADQKEIIEIINKKQKAIVRNGICAQEVIDDFLSYPGGWDDYKFEEMYGFSLIGKHILCNAGTEFLYDFALLGSEEGDDK